MIIYKSRLTVTLSHAGVAELADAPDLGSGGQPWGFKSLHPHHLRFVTSVRNHRGFCISSDRLLKGGLRMSETKSSDVRKKLQQQISLLRQQLNHDNNDLEFETHLHMIRDLESLLKTKA